MFDSKQCLDCKHNNTIINKCRIGCMGFKNCPGFESKVNIGYNANCGGCRHFWLVPFSPTGFACNVKFAHAVGPFTPACEKFAAK